MDFRVSNKGCGHPGLVAACAPEGKVEGFEKGPLEELGSCPDFTNFYTFASGFVHSWVLCAILYPTFFILFYMINTLLCF